MTSYAVRTFAVGVNPRPQAVSVTIIRPPLTIINDHRPLSQPLVLFITRLRVKDRLEAEMLITCAITNLDD